LTQSLRDRDALHQAKAQQDKPFEDVQKLQSQLTALASAPRNWPMAATKMRRALLCSLSRLALWLATMPRANRLRHLLLGSGFCAPRPLRLRPHRRNRLPISLK